MKTITLGLFLLFTLFARAWGCPPTKVPEAAPEAQAKEDANKEITHSAPSPIEKKHPFSLLVFGGGYSPSGNQVSLESNVKYLRRIRSAMGLGEAEMKTFFADGMDKGRDLQFFDPSFRIPEVNQIMAELLGSTRGIANQYRTNKLAPDDKSSIAAIDKWIASRKRIGGDQTNLVYFTGHGGKGDKKTPQNTSAYLWDNARLKVSDFVKKIDQLPKEQACVFVMVQCYSGGFANVIFKEGDPKKGLSDHPRAGFFATVHDRVAAGCTPDIREKNYKEYSTRFWEGLCGESRIGKKVKKPDFDKDGKTSLAEAHAYVVLRSDTIDIPIKTSDVFLRKFSSLTPPRDAKEKTEPESFCLVGEELKELVKGASRESKAVANGLSRKLSLNQPKRHEEAKKLLETLKKKRASIVAEKKKHDEERGKLKRSLAARLRKKWPELKNFHHPTVISLYRKANADEVKQTVDGDGSWKRYQELTKKSREKEKERFAIEKKEVLVMRLIRELETIVLEKNLPLIADQETVKRFETLTKLEQLILPD
tara:strand:+ start:4860 stop:6467 length:1608 start_codon:yes stop_codon:yes gene_type:complete